jgi:hypothetical protein
LTAVATTTVELVRKDVEAGFARWLHAGDQGGFALDDRVPEIQTPITNGAVTAIPWRWTGRHESEHLGLRPTGHTVTVRGVTLVAFQPAGDPRFHRYVDWSNVFGQLGVTMATNPLVPRDTPRPVR